MSSSHPILFLLFSLLFATIPTSFDNAAMDPNHPEASVYGSHLSADSADESSLALPADLPPDLPTSLDDRRPVLEIPSETEIYDPWQGEKIR